MASAHIPMGARTARRKAARGSAALQNGASGRQCPGTSFARALFGVHETGRGKATSTMNNRATAPRPLPNDQKFRLLVESVVEHAVVLLDSNGCVATWGAGAERIYGYAATEIIGSHFSVLYPAETLSRGLPALALEEAARQGHFEDEGWRVRKDGTRFRASVDISAVRDEAQQLVGFGTVTRDVTQRRSHEDALRQSEERFRLLLEGVSEYAIFMLDANGFVTTWNSGAERIKGYAASEIIGQHFSTFYPRSVRDSGWPEHELKVAAQSGRFVDEGWRVRKDGTMFWALVTITALRDSAGTLLGFAKLTRDQSERRRSEELEEADRRREHLLEAERSARIAAQRAIRMKDEFLATLSHELRTPLSAITGWTQVLRRGIDTLQPTELRRAIEVIDRNARLQVQLIDELLDISRIMTGKVHLELKPVDLRDVVQAAAESAQPGAATKHVKLEVALDPAATIVAGDSGRLQQVIWNLLSNAVKFTPSGGEVRLRVKRSASTAELTVTDTGIGIPQGFLPFVFDRFSQRDGSTTRSYGGLGLGLAICKQLVHLHGGNVRAESPGEGLGATFCVTLPLLLGPSPAPAQVDPSREDPAVLPTLSGAHIYIVDDEADVRELVGRVLRDQGAQLSAFGSASEALAALEMARPSLLICDIGMPHMDGYQFIRSLRAREGRDEKTPALALSAFARPEDRKRSLQAGYQAHLSKPFDVAELVLVVSSLLNR
jgi:PAS domain S-box-containing protein